MRTAWLLPLLLTAACGGDEGGEPVDAPPDTNQITKLATPPEDEMDPQVLTRLQPIAAEELEREGMLGAGCAFTRGDQVLLAAVGSDALVKVNGELRHLVHSATVGPTGGFFEDRQLSVSVGRTDEAAAAAEEASRWPARITLTNRRVEARQEIEGAWSCGA